MVDVVDLAVSQGNLLCNLFGDEGKNVERAQLSNHIPTTQKFDNWDSRPMFYDSSPHILVYCVSCDQWLSLSGQYRLLLLPLMTFLPPSSLLFKYQMYVQISVL